VLHRKPKTEVARLTDEIVDTINVNVRRPMDEIIGALRFVGRLRFKSAEAERAVAKMLRAELFPRMREGLSGMAPLSELSSAVLQLKRDLRAIADLDVADETPTGGNAPCPN
jgi:hypothetical protein